MTKKQYQVVRQHGKAYFGEVLREENGLTLGNAVEVVTLMMPAPTGVQKRVIVMGLDYNDGPVKHLYFERPGPRYSLHDMGDEARKGLMADYEKFCSANNLVKVPPQKPLVIP